MILLIIFLSSSSDTTPVKKLSVFPLDLISVLAALIKEQT